MAELQPEGVGTGPDLTNVMVDSYVPEKTEENWHFERVYSSMFALGKLLRMI